ncbi:MAG: hypothetical protein PCFJNLEI_00859 [Verrucomicrobiae bacterium]|nr:hypothetical protein [Verrucomicrobiae bacterium]
MKNKLAWTLGLGAVLVIGASLALLAWLRVDDARQFGQAYKVRTVSGTNYVFQFIETTVGRVATGYVLIVSARLENPNPFPLTLLRDWFVLIDHDKDYYQPILTSGQLPTIAMPANGLLEKEELHYVVPDDTLAGLLALNVGYQYLATFKSDKPMTRQLEPGQFYKFRQRDW